MIATLCGCPQSGQIQCWLWNTDSETGVQTAYPVENFNGIDAPYGAYLHFEGGKIDAGKSWVDYQMVGRDDPVRLNLINPNNKNKKSEYGVEKCSTCTANVVVGLVAIAGYTVPAIVDAVESAREQWFDVVVPMGPVVETATLQVTTKTGEQFVVVLFGEAYDITPPAENAFRLTVKVQGEGVVEVEALDENGVPYSVAEVSTSKVFNADANSDVYFTAKPATSGWRFEKWLVTGDSGETWHGDWRKPEAMVTMESDVEVIAVFVEISAPVDTTAPVITLNGSNPIQLTVGQTFTDPGATAVDAVDGVCNVSVSGTVNTGVAGTYTLTYSAADRSGNQASVTRTVVVSMAPNPETTPKMTYTLTANGSLQQEFTQDGCTLQQCWINFPSNKTWMDVDVMGTMFMVGQNPLLFVEAKVNGTTVAPLSNSAFVPGFTARAVPYIKMKGSSTRLYANTGIVAGYNAAGTRLTRSDGDNYDLSL